MSQKSNAVDPVPSAYPKLSPVTATPPVMPSAWKCVALLHPFSPPLSNDPKPGNPFFQLCVASITYSKGFFLSAQIVGCSYGTWWYVIIPGGTKVSIDKGVTWTAVDMGWQLPTNWFGNQSQNAACAGSCPLNWMEAQIVNWWKIPVPLPAPSPPAATWMWFDADTNAPVRMMFGYGPPSPTMGDPTQLALFQMFSFIYFPVFTEIAAIEEVPAWTTPTFQGFAVGNPDGYSNFVWNTNFGMTVLMTPVNENFNPLPTGVLYVWKPDSEYAVATDRAQKTLMKYKYNSGALQAQEALLMGPPPKGVTPPPNSDTSFIINFNDDGSETCVGPPQFDFPQEPPDWVSIPAVDATIQACITDNPVLCPNNVVTVFSVLFPPAEPNYPEATYLWTWYAPFLPGDGSHSRPVTFMQSQSGVNVGTSLALADYFYYEEYAEPIDPSKFDVPSSCSTQRQKPIARQKRTLRFRLP